MPVAGVGQGDSPQEWFANLPIITKLLFSSILFTGIATTFNMLSAESMIFSLPLIWKRFQIWRLFSCFVFAGGFSFNYAMFLYLFYDNSLRYENNPYNTGGGGTSADFLWMLMLGMAVLCVVGHIFGLMVLSEPLLYMIMYVWSRHEPEAVMSMFGFKFKSLYIVWVYMGIRLIMGGSVVSPLIGVAVGHLYYFLVDVLPNTHGMTLIQTPRICVDMIAFATGKSQGVTGVGVRRGFNPTDAAAGPANRGYQWGAGQTLGGRR